jgi:hypothetical protein
MSWIFGAVGNFHTDEIRNTILSQNQLPLSNINIPGELIILAGGNSETLYTIQNDTITSAVAGIGIQRSNQSTRILSSEAWTSLLQTDIPNFGDLNGHFVAIRFKEGVLECFSDKVGLRTLYFAHTDNGWLFSTKLIWLCRFLPESHIDWNAFASKWLCLQQFSHKSLVHGTFKLPPNSSARIKQNKLIISSSPWISVAPDTESADNSIAILQSLLTVDQRNLKLGMSGGLDSRVLFSLLASGKKNFSTYAFGDDDDPDVLYARKISRHGNIPFIELSSPFPSQDECLRLMNDYVAQTNLTAGAAASARLRHYPTLKENDSLMIDGGNGEIARRQFLQWILFRGKNDILHLQTEKLFPSVQFHRANIFKDELVSEMNNHAVQEFDQFLHSLPSPKEIGVENFLDLWVARTRLPLIACDEQARIDEHVLNFMPYTQPDFIQSVLNLPLRFRNNNRLYKFIIQKHFPSLTRFALVKNYITYPYRLSTLQSRVWTKAKMLIGSQYHEPTVFRFLDAIKEYVLDTVQSSSTENYAPYDYKNVLSIVTSYYNGDRRFADEVNWWIAFDVWRRMVEK